MRYNAVVLGKSVTVTRTATFVAGDGWLHARSRVAAGIGHEADADWLRRTSHEPVLRPVHVPVARHANLADNRERRLWRVARSVRSGRMDCANLDGFLEAFLEGKLRRTQFAMLRRHLTVCAACRSRVDQLRAFECQLHDTVRPMGENQPLWAGLEMDLVGQAFGGAQQRAVPVRDLPPAPPAPTSGAAVRAHRRQRLQMPEPQPAVRPNWTGIAAGALMMIATAGAVWQLVAAWGTWNTLSVPSLSVATGDGAEPLAGSDERLDVASDDPKRVQDWLIAATGLSVEPPANPAGLRLVGGRLAGDTGPGRAVLVYGDGPERALLMVSHADDHGALAAAKTLDHDAVPVTWSDSRAGYVLVSDLPRDRLAAFKADAEHLTPVLAR